MSIKSDIVVRLIKDKIVNLNTGGVMKNILLILFSVSLAVFGQFFLKKGMLQIGEMPLSIGTPFYLLGKVLTNLRLFIGFSLFGLSAVVWLVVLSRVDLSLAYPMVSIGYVFAMFLSWKYLGEEISVIRLAGVAVICCGVFLLSRS